jgi:hypothetical protein
MWGGCSRRGLEEQQPNGLAFSRAALGHVAAERGYGAGRVSGPRCVGSSGLLGRY